MELGRNGVGGAEFEVCGRQNACPLGYPVLIPRICDYLPLHGKRHRPLVADNMGLVPRGETWETPGTGGVVTGARTTRGFTEGGQEVSHALRLSMTGQGYSGSGNL